MVCGSKYTPEKKQHGHDAQTRKQALRLYVDGMNLRRTARHVGVHHTTIMRWVKEYVHQLPKAPQPKQVKTAEMDELFSFIGKKKNKIYLITMMIGKRAVFWAGKWLPNAA